MAVVVRELPTTGVHLKWTVVKTEFATKEGARTGAEELKNDFRCCG